MMGEIKGLNWIYGNVRIDFYSTKAVLIFYRAILYGYFLRRDPCHDVKDSGISQIN